jgi:hypothetical protein
MADYEDGEEEALGWWMTAILRWPEGNKKYGAEQTKKRR